MAMPNRYSLPLFAGTEDAEQLFLATLDNLDADVKSFVDIMHPLWRYLKDSNLFKYKDSIGTEVRYAYMDKENATVKFHTGYDDVNNVPSDPLGVIQYLWGQVVGTQMYNREELVKNSGKQQLIDLVETKTEQLQESMTNFVARNLTGTQTADGRKFNGIGNLMARNTASGGVDPTVSGKEWWNPQLIYKTGTTKYALATEMRPGLRKLFRICQRYGTAPDVLYCGEDVYDAMQDWAEGKLQIRVDELKQSRNWGDFNMFPVYGQTVIYDPDMAAKKAWALNFRSGIQVLIHRGSNFTFEPWQMLPNKVAKKRDCLLYINVSAKDRRCLGEVEFS